MKSLRIISIIGLAFSILIILSSLTLLFLNRTSSEESIRTDISNQLQEYEAEKNNDTDLPKGEETEDEELNVEEEELILKESGWIPDWGFDLGYESLEYNKGRIDTIMPVLYTVGKEGQILSRAVPEAKIRNLLKYCRENSIRVIPTVGSYDIDATSSAFATSSSYSKQIDIIIDEVEKYGFDGIDLDYEMINSEYKENFLNFLKDLSTELGKKKLILSVTLFPQWENAVYKDHQDTRVVQDYKEIGRYADEVRIMAYDYTLQNSKSAGPIGPVNWIEDVLKYATKYIPKEKVWLGIHLYGYQWSSDRTVAFTYTTALSSIVKNENIKDIFKEDIGEGYAQFSCDNGFTCKTYFQTPKGIQMRKDIAEKYAIAGVSYWRLGGELDLLR